MFSAIVFVNLLGLGAPRRPVLQYSSKVEIIEQSDNVSFAGLEGGTAILVDGAYHVFTCELVYPFAASLAKTRLGHWSTEIGAGYTSKWSRVSTVFESSGVMNGTDPRASLWAPMPILDDDGTTWHLYYIGYRSQSKSPSGDWLFNYEGRVFHAISTSGLNGPYKDTGVVLEPDANESQPWEGLQGADSISPPYRLPNKTWMAFYGSAHTEAHPPPQYQQPHMWNVGLATTPALGAPFKRLPMGINPVPLDGTTGHVENPVVTFVPQMNLYIAVFDYLGHEGEGLGFSYSFDGLEWANGTVVPIPGGCRTPLVAMLVDGPSAPNDQPLNVAVFYTQNRALWVANVTLAWQSSTVEQTDLQFVV